ncbi:NAD-glutamate dehydrogenase [Myxococcota bacterium]|nr:NAD-glutamate dehydrogenase [Myxococcota bacterium]
MPVSAKLEGLHLAAASHRGPAGSDPAAFQAFLAEASRQLRAPFLAGHSPVEAVELLAAAFVAAEGYQGPAPRVSHALRGNLLDLRTVMPDQPFIVDTARLLLRSRGFEFVTGFNLVLPLVRGVDGRVLAVDAARGTMESLVFMQVEVEDPAQVEAAVQALVGNLRLCQAMVQAYDPCIARLDALAHRFARLAGQGGPAAVDLRETADFLQWLVADNFVFMGMIDEDDRLGVTSEAVARLWDARSLLSGWDPADPAPVRVRKGQQESRLHRAGRVDEIRLAVPATDDEPGHVVYVQGLFTYRAVSQPSRNVPLLRRMLVNLLARQDSQPGSYRYKGIGNAFDSLPTEFLFTASEEELALVIERVLESEQQQDARAQVVQRQGERVTFALVAMPKWRWSESMRQQLLELLSRATGATYSDHGVFMGRFDTMLAHFFLTGGRRMDAATVDALVARLVDVATPWVDRLYYRLAEQQGAARAAELVLRWGEAFDEDYRRNSGPGQSQRDIEKLDALTPEHPLSADIFVDAEGCINLRIYQARDVLLSDMLPVLDDFGLIVIDQYSNVVQLKDRPPMALDTFRIQGVWGVTDEELLARSPMLIDGIEAVFDKKVDDDLLNRVLLRAAVPWQAVDLLRALLGYSRQLGMGYTLARYQELLLAQPELVHTLWQLFLARFDPDRGADRQRACAQIAERFQELLRTIEDHDQDLVFRTLLNLVESTVRTNFFRTDRAEWSIALKLDHARVWNLPEPRMMAEIYVHHRVVEGVHLRGGPIARGGIRWSDRSDYRREILDLVSTQMVKNVLIVPEGAKGGFFLKKSVSDRDERRRRADEMYELFVRGLLDVTDNLVDGKVVPPPRVVRHDGDDPYLVVAADKGTAHLSDRANQVSRAYGFWLDDAFASGGSHGYDHKKVAITARGAWKLVARHFRELGRDPYRQDLTCIAIGDPSGDVFGNGVLETPHLRLLAAFNHLHVFLDPDPDAARVQAELRRLFTQGLAWEDFDTRILSRGGGVYSRRAKSIQLSPEVQKMLGTLKEELPVDAVIRLILRLDVDLLWNGGIGTWVKASTESHQQAKDPTNDELRINADELRCRVVGEGGNLGFTPEARIEYALRGGRLNSDAIDNSGGVDMSDHEVNLKILLAGPVRRGELDFEARNALLEGLTSTVVDQVLANNDAHGRQISLDQLRTERDPLHAWPTIQWVEARGGRSAADLHLPGADTLRRRATQRQGLVRPELAVLQAHVKMHVFKELMGQDERQIPGFDELVRGYFPERVRTLLPAEVDAHMLRKHIGMTVVLGQVCADAGAEWFPSVMELTGATAVQAAAAWMRVMALVEASRLRRAIEAAVPGEEGRYRAWIRVTDAATHLVASWLAAGEPVPDPAELDGIRDVLERLPRLRGAAHNERLQQRTNELLALGLPAELAGQVAVLGELAVAREITLLRGAGAGAGAIVRYLALGEASRLLPAVRALEVRPTRDRWDPVATGILRHRYLGLMRQLFAVVPLGEDVERLGVDRLAQRLARQGTGELARLQDMMDRVLGADPDLATLLVAEERVRSWIARYPRG